METFYQKLNEQNLHLDIFLHVENIIYVNLWKEILLKLRVCQVVLEVLIRPCLHPIPRKMINENLDYGYLSPKREYHGKMDIWKIDVQGYGNLE